MQAATKQEKKEELGEEVEVGGRRLAAKQDKAKQSKQSKVHLHTREQEQCMQAPHRPEQSRSVLGKGVQEFARCAVELGRKKREAELLNHPNQLCD